MYIFMLPACSEPSAGLLYPMGLTDQCKNVSVLARRIHNTTQLPVRKFSQMKKNKYYPPLFIRFLL